MQNAIRGIIGREEVIECELGVIIAFVLKEATGVFVLLAHLTPEIEHYFTLELLDIHIGFDEEVTHLLVFRIREFMNALVGFIQEA